VIDRTSNESDGAPILKLSSDEFFNLLEQQPLKMAAASKKRQHSEMESENPNSFFENENSKSQPSKRIKKQK
jgi:hypothetical protein